jgi:hypothetical protein
MTEPEGSLQSGLDHGSTPSSRELRQSGKPLRTVSQTVTAQDLLHTALGDDHSPVLQELEELTGTQSRAADRFGQDDVDLPRWCLIRLTRPATLLWSESFEPIRIRKPLPEVEAGARHPDQPTRLGHIPQLVGQLENTDTPQIDNVSSGHGEDSLLDSIPKKDPSRDH